MLGLYNISVLQWIFAQLSLNKVTGWLPPYYMVVFQLLATKYGSICSELGSG